MASSKGQACFAVATTSPIWVRSIPPPRVSKGATSLPDRPTACAPVALPWHWPVAEGREASRRGFVRAPGG